MSNEITTAEGVQLLQDLKDAVNLAQNQLLNVPLQVVHVTTNMTIGPEHANKLVRLNSSLPIVVSVPHNSGLDQTFFCMFTNAGTGSVTFEVGPCCVLDSDSGFKRIYGRYTFVACFYINTNRFQIGGSLY